MAELKLQNLNDNKYGLFYEMMMQSLKTDDVVNGINESLFLLKECLNSGNVVLHKKDDDGSYTYYIGDSTMRQPSKQINLIVKETSLLADTRGICGILLELTPEFHDIMLIHLKTDDNEYILSITNYENNSECNNDLFWNTLKDTMEVILKRAEIYERNVKAISTDLLTGFDNRNSYEMKIQNISDDERNLVYGLFDIFRLKYVNDNYSHAVGDVYIKEVAKILNKYWPKQTKERYNDCIQFTDTGNCIYRVGGDEFVLFTHENLGDVKEKANLAADEVKSINLGVDRLPVGLNVGIVYHHPGEYMKQTYMSADALMCEDKKQMYKAYGLERRI